MGNRPNFTKATLTEGGKVHVEGISEEEDRPGEIIEIRVVLIQGETVNQARVDNRDGVNWFVDISNPPSGDYGTGAAVAYGTEMRLDRIEPGDINRVQEGADRFFTVTWTHPVTIDKLPSD